MPQSDSSANPALLAHSLIPAPVGETTALIVFLHGILGSGANLRTLAKKVLAQKPGYGALLVDLRMHGQSQGFASPHTVASAAADLLALTRSLSPRVEAIVGHSFGGKVALEYVRQIKGDLAEATLLDSMPGPRLDHTGSEGTLQVVSVLEQMPATFASRDEFMQIARNAGLSEMLVAWLAMNVAGDRQQFRFRLDLQAIHALLDDYFRVDLWPTIETLPGRVKMHLVLGATSNVFSVEAKARALAFAARNPSRLLVTVIPNAGHWLHVDAPEATLEAIVATGQRFSS